MVHHQDTPGTNQHQQRGHGQRLTVIQRAGLRDIAVDGNWEGGVLGAGQEGRCAKFTQGDGQGEYRADQQGRRHEGQVDFPPDPKR